MTPHKPIRFIVSPEMRTAIEKRCQAQQLEMSDYIRRLIAADLQQPELLQTVRGEGAPARKTEPLPRKKATRKRG